MGNEKVIYVGFFIAMAKGMWSRKVYRAAKTAALSSVVVLLGCARAGGDKGSDSGRDDDSYGVERSGAVSNCQDNGPVERALDSFQTHAIAGFDTNAIADLRRGNSAMPFMLNNNAEYSESYNQMAASPEVDSVRKFIESDSSYCRGDFPSAVVILTLGADDNTRPPYIAVCVYGPTGGKMYWSEFDGRKEISVLTLLTSIPRLVDTILSRHPGSVEERGADGNRTAFMSVVTPRDHYALIAAPWVSTVGVAYGKEWQFSNDIPYTSFLKRQAVDSLMSVVARKGDSERWGDVW